MKFSLRPSFVLKLGLSGKFGLDFDLRPKFSVTSCFALARFYTGLLV